MFEMADSLIDKMMVCQNSRIASWGLACLALLFLKIEEGLTWLDNLQETVHQLTNGG